MFIYSIINIFSFAFAFHCLFYPVLAGTGWGWDETRRCRVESGLVWFGLLCSHFSFFHAYYVCFVEIISFFFCWSKCCQTGFSTLMQSTVQSLLLPLPPLLLLLARFLQLIMQLKPASESKSAAQIGLFYPCSSRPHASSILALPRLSVCLPLSLFLFLCFSCSWRGHSG